MKIKQYVVNEIRKSKIGNNILFKIQDKMTREKIVDEILAGCQAYNKIIIFGSDEIARTVDNLLGERCLFLLIFHL